MPLICYQPRRFSEDKLDLIAGANVIIQDYNKQGFSLTLRQLYYQFVSRDILPQSWANEHGVLNNPGSYTKLGNLISDARMAGLIDWNAIVDRSRSSYQNVHWDRPSKILEATIQNYAADKWENQSNYLECFTPATPVINCYGNFRSIVKINVLDSVFTHEGRFKKVTAVTKRFYSGKMLRVKAVGLLPLDVTPDHPFWSCLWDRHPKQHGFSGAGRRRFSGACWTKASKLNKWDYVQIPLLADDYRCSIKGKQVNVVGGRRSVPYSFMLDDLTLKVCGLYVAEGGVNLHRNGSIVGFTFNAIKEQSHADLVLEWADRMGVGSYKYKDGNALHVLLYSKAVAMWFVKNFGGNAFKKKLPSWLMFANKDEQLTLLEYYFRGDACLWDKTRADLNASTRSLTLARQVQLIMLWARLSCTLGMIIDYGKPKYGMSVAGKSADELSKRWNMHIPIKGVGRSKRYNYVQFNDKYAQFVIKSIEQFDYHGNVYNLEVADDSSYCTPVAVHNCWVEKESLEEVLQRACAPLDVRFFACKGYTSLSSMWEASQRLLSQIDKGKEVHIIHLGDHDPSGIDMTRDITERLSLFVRGNVHVERIALNIDQVRRYNPPPNPAKQTDSRFVSYEEHYGQESWELDALDPALLITLITDAIKKYRDETLWQQAVKNEDRGRHTLQCIVKYFPDVVKFIRERRKQDKSRVICQECGATEEFPKCTCLEKTDRPGLEIE